MSKKKFIVKPEDKIVIGIHKDYERPILRELFGNFNEKQLKLLMDLCCQKGYLLPEKPIRAVARCSDEDTWDVETGKKVAESKLDLKRHARFIRQYDVLLGEVHKIERKLYELQEEHVDKFEKISDDFDHYFCGKVD